MLDEVIHGLDPLPGQTIVDGTLGGGGHTRALAERVGPTGLVLALDRDPAALAAAERNLAGRSIKLVAANFRELPEVLTQLEIPAVDGIVLDLGLSSDQLADAGARIQLRLDGPLDLRFDPTSGEPAWRLIERLDATELADLIFKYGEERHSRRIARNIVEQRSERADSHGPATGRDRAAQRAARSRVAADRSGDADVSGPADRGERRIGIVEPGPGEFPDLLGEWAVAWR